MVAKASGIDSVVVRVVPSAPSASRDASGFTPSGDEEPGRRAYDALVYSRLPLRMSQVGDRPAGQPDAWGGEPLVGVETFVVNWARYSEVRIRLLRGGEGRRVHAGPAVRGLAGEPADDARRGARRLTAEADLVPQRCPGGQPAAVGARGLRKRTSPGDERLVRPWHPARCGHPTRAGRREPAAGGHRSRRTGCAGVPTGAHERRDRPRGHAVRRGREGRPVRGRRTRLRAAPRRRRGVGDGVVRRRARVPRIRRTADRLSGGGLHPPREPGAARRTHAADAAAHGESDPTVPRSVGLPGVHVLRDVAVSAANVHRARRPHGRSTRRRLLDGVLSGPRDLVRDRGRGARGPAEAAGAGRPLPAPAPIRRVPAR